MTTQDPHRKSTAWKKVRLRVLAGQPQYCYLCNGSEGPIRYDLKYPHPLSPSVDHVIPINRGGQHWQSNVKSAHRICNTIKSTRDVSPELIIQCKERITEELESYSAE